MRVGPQARIVLLGVGLGLGLALLEVGAPRGWWSGVTALVNLVPIALAVALGGPPAAALAIVTGVGGVTLALGASGALAVGLKEALPGLALGLCLRRRLSLPVTLLIVSAVSVAGLALLLWALVPTGTSPVAYLEHQIAAHVADLEQLPGRFGVAGDPGWAADSARFVASTMQVAGPGVILLGVLLGTIVNYLGARLCLRGEGFRPFAREAVPDHLVWVVIAGGLLLAAGQPAVVSLGVNLLIVLAPFYAIQGFAVFRHFFLRVRVPRALQVLSFGLFAMQPLLLIAVACVGLSDLWVDFRKIRQAPTPA